MGTVAHQKVQWQQNIPEERFDRKTSFKVYLRFSLFERRAMLKLFFNHEKQSVVVIIRNYYEERRPGNAMRRQEPECVKHRENDFRVPTPFAGVWSNPSVTNRQIPVFMDLLVYGLMIGLRLFIQIPSWTLDVGDGTVDSWLDR
ncbi:hypothetical protein G5I_00073 [Acromyrmex echinatior]|uniref:Uncharacterized protein n=1 Tax=Acromyrmex echinatior TaxID=103372 RepID=F4W3X2_ACREC|nr:hypothetical protein G5I_00073 [Acromyrmex echinatior]